MRPILVLSLAFLAGLVSPAQADQKPSTVEVKINPAVTWGTWEGWGASLAWWGKVFGNRADLADLYFTTKPVKLGDELLPGLGFNIARYNAGATATREFDGRRMVVSKDILPFRQIDGFWLDDRNPDPASPSWDWSVDANQRAMLLMARDRGANLFELFSNSPMWWMCKNDNPSGAAKADQDNLDPAHYQDFAHYLATIARHAKDRWDITFTTVAAFNEPTAPYWFANGKQEGCHVSAAEQIKILPIVRAALDKQGLQEIDLSASDESLYDQAVAAWKAYTPEAKAIVKQVNVHGYQGAGGDRRGLYRMAVTEDRKRLWNSEHGDDDAKGLTLAKNLHRDFSELRLTAWCYWQPIDGGRRGKGGSGWGLMDADMNVGRLLRVNGKHFVLAHYSRHIKPGMVIIDTGHPQTVAAYDAKARKLVIVSLNEAETEHAFNYDLSAFTGINRTVASWLTETDGKARYQVGTSTDAIRDDRLVARIPAKSVRTFELTDVSLAPRQP